MITMFGRKSREEAKIRAIEARVRAEVDAEHQEALTCHVDEVVAALQQHSSRNNFAPRIAAALRLGKD